MQLELDGAVTARKSKLNPKEVAADSRDLVVVLPKTPGDGGDDADDGEEFQWGGDSTVLQEQPATAIYLNPKGELVIRQERTWSQEEDTVIVVCANNTQQFLDALCDRLGIGSAP